MERNVLSWGKALNNGYNPSLYPFQPGSVPVGDIIAKLDFKIWAKKVVAISCYFTQIDTGTRFQVSIYCSPTCGYKVRKEGIDFTTCPTDSLYQITTAVRQTGKVFVKAVMEVEGDADK